jgi:hypothetical protein
MTDDAPRLQMDIEQMDARSAMERIAALETRVALIEMALRRAHGDRWLDELVMARDQLEEQVKAEDNGE